MPEQMGMSPRPVTGRCGEDVDAALTWGVVEAAAGSAPTRNGPEAEVSTGWTKGIGRRYGFTFQPVEQLEVPEVAPFRGEFRFLPLSA
ncbi:hypothetical protein M2266_003560 [Streptomyces sp. SPB162]|nr:hypothetical protein [Streptomyces sp. SPB162]